MTSSPSSSFRKGSTTPPPPPPQPKQVKIPKQGRFNYGSATVFCLLVASLSVMLFYGRVCAILWTCTWFYSLPCRRRGCGVSCLIGGGGPADGAKEETTRGRRRAVEGEETKRNRKF
ncbi:hypothetical protein QJS04_geneDACA021968 [Acorus gramineus]|uniref:Transmembrane protein n=1 Tax=Acorus gramineus TaxID=55184 RepID=A0AAV9AAK5_ACOGR|nr:hypothetical protein QJS04_geneDACA021968 [Acorus gramineus]